MNKLIFFLSLLCVFSTLPDVSAQDGSRRTRRKSAIDSTIFRGNWWDYYNRAIRRIESGQLEEAESDLRAALKKRSKDDPEARTYGVRFQEYYPHAELGVLLYDSGHYEEAIRELEMSASQAPLEQTSFFLHEARRKVVISKGLDREPPRIDLLAPEQRQVTNQLSILVKGSAGDDTYVDQIWVGGERLFLKKAQSSLEFQSEVPLPNVRNDIAIRVVDLAGKEVTETVEIIVDRQGPVFSVDKVELLAGEDLAVISGSAFDRSGVESLKINDQPISIDPNKRIDFEDLQVPLSEKDGRVRVLIHDSYGNETNVDIDPKKQVGFLPQVSRPVQLSAVHFNPLWLVGAVPEEGAPEIKIKNLEEGQQLFVSEFLVELEITDPDGVDEVRCNGERLDIVPGKKSIHSSFIWGPILKDSTQTLEVSAKDSAGRITQRQVQSHFDVRSDLGRGRRLCLLLGSVEILGEKEKGDLEEIFKVLFDMELNQRNRFDFAPDEESLREMLPERLLGQQSVTDPRNQGPAQGFLSADLNLKVKIICLDDSATAVMFVSHVRSAASEEILEARAFSSGLSTESLTEMARTLSHKLMEAFPIVEGEITDTANNFQCSLCMKHGVFPGVGVIAYRESNPGSRIIVGPMLIEYVWSKASQLKPAESLSTPPEVGDIVVTR